MKHQGQDFAAWRAMWVSQIAWAHKAEHAKPWHARLVVLLRAAIAATHEAEAMNVDAAKRHMTRPVKDLIRHTQYQSVAAPYARKRGHMHMGRGVPSWKSILRGMFGQPMGWRVVL
jgi:hypothetical protein